ncbi:MAG: hypothetical protein EA397_15570 [Deltaproteobacteria bacterium]|nr:MAG: hypothetical protein EA397_15570 [Deltaproteobacteria bacterium]
MRVLLIGCLVLAGCASVVKGEGFRAKVLRAHEPAMKGRFSGSEGSSCGVDSPQGRELRLRGEGFSLISAEPPRKPEKRHVVLEVDGERFVSDRSGAKTTMVLESPGGRLIGSLSGVLVHESAGTLVEGRPAPIRELEFEVTFNLQPCL